MPSTYAPDFKSVPTAHVTGSAVTLVNAAIISGKKRSPDFKVVSCATGNRTPVTKINATIRGVRRIPQPFANALLTLFEGSDVQLKDGYVNHPYFLDWNFTSDPILTVFGGSLPPGLSLTVPSRFEWKITGTPTTVGTYTLVIKVLVADTVGFITLHITIYDDPDEGSSFVGGL